MNAVRSGSLATAFSARRDADDLNSASPEVGSKYCDAQVAAGAEDYYLGRDESPGQWRGSGASALDLTLGAG